MTSDQKSQQSSVTKWLCLVDGVTKLTQLNYVADKVEVQAENLAKNVPRNGKRHSCYSDQT